MPDGSVIRTAKLIAGPTAEGERWELRPGRSGCRRCLDLDPGPQMDTSPGSSSGPEPGRSMPGNAEAEPAAAAQGAGRCGRPDRPSSYSGITLSDEGGLKRTHADPPLCVAIGFLVLID